jgi:putative ABC transport system permease protein
MLSSEGRYAVRTLGQSPGFSAVVVVSLGLALGVATTMFAVLDSSRQPITMLRAPESLYEVRLSTRGRKATIAPDALYDMIRTEGRFHAGLSAEHWLSTAVLQTPVDQRAVSAARVTPNYFEILGASAARGRVYSSADAPSDNERTVVVSEAIWSLLFGSAGDLQVARLSLNDTSYVVVGVLPASWGKLGFPSILIGSSYSAMSGSTGELVRMFGRLQPGSSVGSALAELAVFGDRVDATAEDRFTRHPPIRAEIIPFSAPIGGIPGFHVLLGIAAALTLIIACANVSTLLLVRGTRRRSEMALRSALGATRADLVRLLLTESGVLAVAGAVLGLLLAIWACIWLCTACRWHSRPRSANLG